MRSNGLNVLLFLVFATGLYFLMEHAQNNWIPKPQKKEADPAALVAAEEESKRLAEEREGKKTAAGAVAGNAAIAVEPLKPAKPPETPKIVAAPRERIRPTLIAMGDDTFNNKVLLSTEGGGIQTIDLPKFAEANRLGQEVKGTDLHLIPGVPRVRKSLTEIREHDPPIPDLPPGPVSPDTILAEPAYTLSIYPTPDDKFPDPFLSEVEWKVVSREHPAGGEHKVVFETTLGEPYFVKFRKTYTLAPQDYHIGLKIEIERLPGGEKGKGQLRYQLSGPRGLPIEGEWYTTTFRNALVGWLDRKGMARRQFETAAEVAAKRGGELVPKGENRIQYMAIATQYFASVVAIDDTAEGAARNPWAYVRATTELPLDKQSNPDHPQFDDVSIRAASDTLDLAPGEKVTHSYIIYNGPAKVRLLGFMGKDREVDPALVERYQTKLGLQTITDYQSPTWLGTFASTIYWTDLVIAFTNLMHWLMWAIHTVVPWWACIIVLTIMVRLILLYPSKKQTKMNMRMMEIQKKLAPQFEELKKKYGDDFNGYNRAKMQLMMSHGVNPAAQLGGCLLLFAQMPVMMGLYFCLQESVFFRLEPFLWVNNLAAPDMTVWWGEHIPYLSTYDGIGGMLYLGPYFNVLPLLAIGLMMWQQLKMLPPPTDEQSRQQRTMMKMMMFMMPIFFYKFAAGLALYFIIGTTWGLIERRLIPKADLSKTTATTEPSTNGTVDAVPAKPPGAVGRFREALQKRLEDARRLADEQSRRQFRNDKGGPPDRKKKRRK